MYLSLFSLGEPAEPVFQGADARTLGAPAEPFAIGLGVAPQPALVGFEDRTGDLT